MLYILHLTELISDIYGSVVLTGKGHRDDTLCLLLLAQHKSLVHPDDAKLLLMLPQQVIERIYRFSISIQASYYIYRQTLLMLLLGVYRLNIHGNLFYCIAIYIAGRDACAATRTDVELISTHQLLKMVPHVRYICFALLRFHFFFLSAILYARLVCHVNFYYPNYSWTASVELYIYTKLYFFFKWGNPRKLSY